ncbi:hypothetical protein LshimejAT787_0409440 [Lyophyllum shimeji]|uniref:F-box domain-containing protein n=1 Tax=Lyophyllum shimeji TaxID=47721 RepID=A0A9P3PM00_LYOSH|nr:hypothetical protein LshimejAT787_0409440 [Lyophyllum shimeji]
MHQDATNPRTLSDPSRQATGTCDERLSSANLHRREHMCNSLSFYHLGDSSSVLKSVGPSTIFYDSQSIFSRRGFDIFQKHRRNSPWAKHARDLSWLLAAPNEILYEILANLHPTDLYHMARRNTFSSYSNVPNLCLAIRPRFPKAPRDSIPTEQHASVQVDRHDVRAYSHCSECGYLSIVWSGSEKPVVATLYSKRPP